MSRVHQIHPWPLHLSFIEDIIFLVAKVNLPMQIAYTLILFCRYVNYHSKKVIRFDLMNYNCILYLQLSIDSPVSPSTVILPLIFVVSVTMVKQVGDFLYLTVSNRYATSGNIFAYGVTNSVVTAYF